MLSVEDWAEIRRLRRSERLSISEIARVMGIARNTVKAALASEGIRRGVGLVCKNYPVGGKQQHEGMASPWP